MTQQTESNRIHLSQPGAGNDLLAALSGSDDTAKAEMLMHILAVTN